MPRFGRTVPRALFRVLLLSTASTCLVQADGKESAGVTSIIGKLSSFRDGTMALCDSAATSLRESGAATEAEKVKKFSEDWLSIFGVSKGITGLAKDFVFNYLGRSAYHDSNGPLIGALRHVATTTDPDADPAILRRAMLEVCKEGTAIFKEGGSLHTMLTELSEILKVSSNTAHFANSLKSSPEVKKAFEYFTSDRPDDEDDEEEEL
mmetsp:Transcript_83124/g.178197  ORF Transcript_83124/g.178197 Transcript_83124/m.178197 type:complete len:208 (+) Transcript_83124:126-749(+)